MKTRQKHSNQKYVRKAFTLVEILVIVAIALIIFVALTTKLEGSTDKAKTASIQTDFKSYQVALKTVGIENQGFLYGDTTEENLELLAEKVNKNLDPRLHVIRNNTHLETMARDPYGTPYVLGIKNTIHSKGEVIMVSAGMDRKLFTEDDVASSVIYHIISFGTNIEIKNYVENIYPCLINGCNSTVEEPTIVYLKSSATCTKKAVYYYKCDICNRATQETYEHGEVAEHMFFDRKMTDEYLAVLGNCVTKTKYYYKCRTCDLASTETYDGKTEEHVFTKEDPTSIYLAKEATCKAKALYYYCCVNCGEKGVETYGYGSLAVHSTTVGTNCKDIKTCEDCGRALTTAGPHIPGSAATCGSPQTCTICGYIITPASGSHDPVLINKRDATCSTPGYTGDVSCTRCNHIITKGEVIPSLPHQMKSDHSCGICNQQNATKVLFEQPYIMVDPTTGLSTELIFLSDSLFAIAYDTIAMNAECQYTTDTIIFNGEIYEISSDGTSISGKDQILGGENCTWTLKEVDQTYILSGRYQIDPNAMLYDLIGQLGTTFLSLEFIPEGIDQENVVYGTLNLYNGSTDIAPIMTEKYYQYYNVDLPETEALMKIVFQSESGKCMGFAYPDGTKVGLVYDGNFIIGVQSNLESKIHFGHKYYFANNGSIDGMIVFYEDGSAKLYDANNILDELESVDQGTLSYVGNTIYVDSEVWGIVAPNGRDLIILDSVTVYFDPLKFDTVYTHKSENEHYSVIFRENGFYEVITFDENGEIELSTCDKYISNGMLITNEDETIIASMSIDGDYFYWMREDINGNVEFVKFEEDDTSIDVTPLVKFDQLYKIGSLHYFVFREDGSTEVWILDSDVLFGRSEPGHVYYFYNYIIAADNSIGFMVSNDGTQLIQDDEVIGILMYCDHELKNAGLENICLTCVKCGYNDPRHNIEIINDSDNATCRSCTVCGYEQQHEFTVIYGSKLSCRACKYCLGKDETHRYTDVSCLSTTSCLDWGYGPIQGSKHNTELSHICADCGMNTAENIKYDFRMHAYLTNSSETEENIIIPEYYKDIEGRWRYTNGIALGGFYNNTYVKTIVIPTSVTIIEQQVFDGCTSLTDVYYMGSEEQWNNIVIELFNPDLESATIHFNYIP